MHCGGLTGNTELLNDPLKSGQFEESDKRWLGRRIKAHSVHKMCSSEPFLLALQTSLVTSTHQKRRRSIYTEAKLWTQLPLKYHLCFWVGDNPCCLTTCIKVQPYCIPRGDLKQKFEMHSIPLFLPNWYCCETGMAKANGSSSLRIHLL